MTDRFFFDKRSAPPKKSEVQIEEYRKRQLEVKIILQCREAR